MDTHHSIAHTFQGRNIDCSTSISFGPSVSRGSTGPYQSKRCHHLRDWPLKACFLANMTRRLVSLLTNTWSITVRVPKINRNQNIYMKLLVSFGPTGSTNHYPSPTSFLRQKSTNYWPDYGAQQGTQCKDCGCGSTFIWVKKIGHDAAANWKARRATKPRK